MCLGMDYYDVSHSLAKSNNITAKNKHAYIKWQYDLSRKIVYYLSTSLLNAYKILEWK